MAHESPNFAPCAVMNDDNNRDASPVQTLPALQEWSNWKRRSFVALLCLLEIALVTALVYGVVVLWNMLEF